MDFETTHPFILTYLRYVENTESPRLFHIWSALSCVSAALGRRCWFPTDLGPMWPNMYVALVGQPATRKGTSIKIATNLLRATTKVKFAPNDTGGQRQGLIRAMLETGTEDEDAEIMEALGNVQSPEYDTLNSVATVDLGLSQLASVDIDMRDPHTMFAAASEFNSLIGENSTSMLTFLQEMWDGVPYKYQLKGGAQVLNDALLNLLAGTTPTQISVSLPQQAVGGGFTSRIIFVHGAQQYKRVARPSLNFQVEPQLKEIFSEIYNRMEGPFEESKDAATLIDEIYMRGITLNDTRFLHYCDRRGDHIRKVCMGLAASRGTQVIEAIDVQVADNLLMLTEKGMPDALGEYGVNKTSLAKQRLLDYVRGATGPTPTSALFGIMSRDMTQLEFKQALMDLHNTKKLTVIVLPEMGQCVIATDNSGARRAKQEMATLEYMVTAKRA